MKITLTNPQRLILLNLLKKSSAGGTALPPIQTGLQNVLDILETPIETPEKTYDLPVTQDTARDINQRLYRQFGFAMEPECLGSAHPQEVVLRLVYHAIENTFENFALIGYLRKKEKIMNTEPQTSTSKDATLCIIFEMDGAIMGYFVLTDSILAEIDASDQDEFTYLFDASNEPPTCHDRLVDALADIKEQGLELKDEFGCCAY